MMALARVFAGAVLDAAAAVGYRQPSTGHEPDDLDLAPVSDFVWERVQDPDSRARFGAVLGALTAHEMWRDTAGDWHCRACPGSRFGRSKRLRDQHIARHACDAINQL